MAFKKSFDAFLVQLEDKDAKSFMDFLIENLEIFLAGEKERGSILAYEWDCRYVHNDVYIISLAVINFDNELYLWNEVIEPFE